MAIMVAVAPLLTLCTLAVYVNAQNTTFPVPSYYVLGDGYFDAGNNNYIRNRVPHANFNPYGMTYFHRPTGRFCDGRVFPDLLAVPLKLPQAPPSLSNLTIQQEGTCVNYASGGSAILNASSAAWGAKNAFTFDGQVTEYEGHAVDVIYQYGVEQALLILNDAIYQLSFGTIDILAYFTNAVYATSCGPIQSFVETLAENYLGYVNSLYDQGARKLVIFGVAPIQLSPFGQLYASKLSPEAAKNWNAAVDSAVRLLNTELLSMVTQLNNDSALDALHASIQLVFADVYGAVSAITINPYKYGLTDATNACCGAGSFGAAIPCGHRNSKTCKALRKSLYWDQLQFTEAGNKQLFKLFWDGSVWVNPFSVKHLAKMLIPGVPY